MKNLNRILLVFFSIFGLVIYSSDSYSFFITDLLKSPSVTVPTINPPGTIVTVAKSVSTTALTAQKTVNTAQNTANNMLTAVNSLYNYDLTTLVDGAISPGQLEVEKCKAGDVTVDIYDQESVANAVHKFFFTEPHPSEQDDFIKYRKKFQNDSVSEIFTAAQQLALHMETVVKKNLEDTKKEVTDDKNNKGNNEAAYSEASALDAIDNVLMVLEKAVALKAQLRAVQAINAIEPVRYQLQVSGNRNESDETSPSSSSSSSGSDTDNYDYVEPQNTDEALKDNLALLEQPQNFRQTARAVLQNEMPLAFAQMLVTETKASSRQTVGTAAQNAAVLTSKNKAATSSVAKTALSVSSASAMKNVSASAGVVSAVSSAERSVSDQSNSGVYIKKTLGYSEGPESEQFHPFTYEEEKMEELDKLEPISEEVQAAISAHNTIRDLQSYRNAAESYHQAINDYQKAVTALGKSNQCALRYISRRYASPEIVWVGQSLPELTEYEDRKGISGWAIEAFETAKASQVTTTTADDYVSASVDIEVADVTGNIEDNDKIYEQTVGLNAVSTGSPSQQEQNEKENREAQLIPWEVGAEASKLLAETPAQWGTLKQKFPVWTDTKSFYNQYINGKYNNIQSYLTQFSVNDVKALIVAQLNGQNKEPQDTLKQKEFQKLNSELNNQNKQLLEEQSSASQSYLKQRQSAETVLTRQRDEIKANLEKASARYKEISDELSDLRQQLEDESIQKLHDSVTYQEEYPETSVLLPSDKLMSHGQPVYAAKLSAHFTLAAAKLETTAEISEKLQNDISSSKESSSISKLETELKSAEKNVNTLKQQLEAVEKQIARQKLEAQNKVSSLNKSFSSKISSIFSKIKEAKEKYEAKYAEDAAAGVNSIATGVVNSQMEKFMKNNGAEAVYNGPTIAGLAGGLNLAITKALDDLYERVSQRINQTKRELAGLGDNLYNPETHEQIVAIHQRMVNDIKIMALTVNYKGLGVASQIYLFEKLLTADTTAETEGYFVGSPAKERDLKAPKQIDDFSLPPLREVVFFDETDFQNVKPYDASRKKSEAIAKEDFLNYGREIPKIWRYILQDNAFVESEINLKAVLNEGCTREAFFRGGFMPCRVSGSNVIVDVNSSGEYIRGNSGSDLSECPYLEMRGGSVYNTMRGQDIDFSFSKNNPAYNCTYSELGTLLDADDSNTLFFKQSAYDAYHAAIEEEQKAASTGDDGEVQSLRKAYGDGILNKNQIGDYLRYIENEQKYRKFRDELKLDYEEMIQNLKDLLAKYGYEPTEEFDISKQADFDKIRRRLESIKNQSINEALSQIGEVNVDDNEVVSERVDKFNSVIAALQKDKEVLTTITEAVVDNNSLDEEIKSSKVNEEVAGKYTDHLDEMAGQNALPAAPYCAIY